MIWILWARFVDALLGERCHHCHTRVFIRDEVEHYKVCGRPSW